MLILSVMHTYDLTLHLDSLGNRNRNSNRKKRKTKKKKKKKKLNYINIHRSAAIKKSLAVCKLIFTYVRSCARSQSKSSRKKSNRKEEKRKKRRVCHLNELLVLVLVQVYFQCSVFGIR